MTQLLALAERNVPRYTSYPTAPHFSAAVGDQLYRDWLAALPTDARLSLYLHVPFCTHLCLYCGCNTKAVRQRTPVEQYASRLAREIDLVGAAAGIGRPVTHLHWGGGTPSILGERLFAELVERLDVIFDLSALDEHAIELDPRHMPNAKALARLGVNRASLGVQDFSDHVQRAIGRIQPFELVARAADELRDAGIERVNIDLMYGLPGQRVGDVIRSAELAASLRPSRLALFGYAHVPWFKPHQKLIADAALPGPAERIAQMHAAAETLEECGYVQIGLDHFALPGDELAKAERQGKLHRNFQGYTTDAADALIGLGASSIGKLPQGFVQNAPDLHGYNRAIDAGQFATVKGRALDAEDRLRANIIERLMCDLVVDLDAAQRGCLQHQEFTAELGALASLSDAGMVQVEGHRVVVTEQGRPFVRLAAAVFDAYLPRPGARHSMAV
jgi:oxygen-independent coproporphyrinogen III oxidase